MTIETEESVVLNRSLGQHSCLIWCPACRRQVEMVTPEQAALIAGVSERTIYRWVEAGRIHVIKDSGVLLLCLSAVRTSGAQVGDSEN